MSADAPKAAVKRAEEVEKKVVAAGRATEVQVLVGPGDGAPNFALRRFIMGEGGGMPLHTNLVEHEQYVLAGRARMTVGDAVHEVAAGNTLYIPAGMPHSYTVLEAPFEFLCVVPNSPGQDRDPRTDLLKPAGARPVAGGRRGASGCRAPSPPAAKAGECRHLRAHRAGGVRRRASPVRGIRRDRHRRAAARAHLREGWGAPERSGTTSFAWGAGPLSRFAFELVAARDLELGLRGWSFPFARRPASKRRAVRANGPTAGEAGDRSDTRPTCASRRRPPGCAPARTSSSSATRAGTPARRRRPGRSPGTACASARPANSRTGRTARTPGLPELPGIDACRRDAHPARGLGCRRHVRARFRHAARLGCGRDAAAARSSRSRSKTRRRRASGERFGRVPPAGVELVGRRGGARAGPLRSARSQGRTARSG